ncbi:transmembrane protein 198-like [Phycodurus eques]|uniref:transmembrane protein 198-like n=1 Tax=Phycodurus eques TaxID=693459 RepID=UPI002ACD308C|nr:transmembrane protein 198-like [Phycodurus eques]XP_061531079.1 transmembrane protein 198-like [Phycodurus eques]
MAFTVVNATEELLAEVDICMFENNSRHEVVPSIVCFVCLSFGLIYCFLGYRCFKMVIFFSGFLFGSTSVLWLYHSETLLQVHPGAETKTGIGLGAGVLCGLASMLVSTLGLLLCGLQLGCLLSCTTLVIIGQFYSVTPVWVPLSVIMAAGIATAVLTLQWQKLFVIIYTSFFGATTVVLCVDYLLGAFMLLDQVYDMFCQASPLPLCWFNWVITGICPLFGLTGVLTQWNFTSKGASHTKAAHKNRKKHAKKHKYAEFRRRQHYRRRGPPPLKRYAGDVLAPSYLRSLQERQAGTGSSTSSDSTITHTLIDFDFETGSMVSLTAASPACMV